MFSKIKSVFTKKNAQSVVLPIILDKLFGACYRILHPEKVETNFDITVGQSKIPNAGYGLLVAKGTIKKGDVVALYSGYYFPPPPVWSVASPDGEQPLKPFHINTLSQAVKHETAAYQIHCGSQGGYIDGIEYTPQKSHSNPHGIAALKKPYTSAQLINHPPAGTMPNVFSPDFSWNGYLTYVREHNLVGAAEVDKELEIIEQVNSIGTGAWYYDPWTCTTVMLSARCAPCAGLAAVALRDIEQGEEVYLDYKYHKDDQPEWYTAVKEA